MSPWRWSSSVGLFSGEGVTANACAQHLTAVVSERRWRRAGDTTVVGVVIGVWTERDRAAASGTSSYLVVTRVLESAVTTTTILSRASWECVSSLVLDGAAAHRTQCRI